MSLLKKTLFTTTLASTLVLVACGNKEEGNSEENEEAVENVEVATEGFPIVEEPIQLTIMAPNVGQAEWENMPTLQEYEELTNVQLNYSTPPQSDFGTRLNLAFASGDLPDILYAAGPNTFNAAAEVDYGTQGMLIPLEDMLEEYAPNFYALIKENPEIRQNITATDGHIYALPSISQTESSSWIMGPIWYNGEWLDALGVDEIPQTIEEFYDLLVRFREEDPNGNGEQDEIPISDVSLDGIRHWLMPSFGIKGWGIEDYNGTARYTFATDNFRAYLEYMNQLYEEGLLDPETFSQSPEQKQAKGENNRVGVFQDWFSYFMTGQTEEEAMNNPMFGPLTSKWQKEPLMPLAPGMTRGAFAITSENPYPEASLRWIDYFYSEEGYDFIHYGPEGYLWEWEDEESGTRVYNDELPENRREEYRGTITPAYGITIPALNISLDPIGGERSPFDDFLESETKEKIEQHGEIIFPMVYLTPEEQEEVNDIQVDMESFIIESEAEFVTGAREINDESWDAYISTLEGIGVRRFEEIHQDALNRWYDSAK